MIRFGSVCSGVEAASLAFKPLGWSAAWFSEIEPFPCELLKQRYPNVPNLGDMTKIPEKIKAGEIELPDVLCGGCPCQAFSFAGLRRSLDDARGNLTLKYFEIANELDSARSLRGLPPVVIFYENVPGILITKDNAFGCFLGGGLLEQTLPYRPVQIDGRAVVLLPVRNAKPRGGSSTLNISECPNDAVASTLSQVLERGSIPQRFFLSERACRGILRRAEFRKKTLPPTLKEVLERTCRANAPQL